MTGTTQSVHLGSPLVTCPLIARIGETIFYPVIKSARSINFHMTAGTVSWINHHSASCILNLYD